MNVQASTKSEHGVELDSAYNSQFHEKQDQRMSDVQMQRPPSYNSSTVMTITAKQLSEIIAKVAEELKKKEEEPEPTETNVSAFIVKFWTFFCLKCLGEYFSARYLKSTIMHFIEGTALSPEDV